MRTALISTWDYVVLVALFVFILVTYTSLTAQDQTTFVENPSQATYEELLDRYPTTLLCPCSQITIPYGSFVSILLNYHNVYRSFFVFDEWISLLSSLNISRFYQLDFRSSASYLTTDIIWFLSLLFFFFCIFWKIGKNDIHYFHGHLEIIWKRIV